LSKLVDLPDFMFGLTVRTIKVFKPKKQFTLVDVGTQPSNHGCA
jgi:hypothetical protein